MLDREGLLPEFVTHVHQVRKISGVSNIDGALVRLAAFRATQVRIRLTLDAGVRCLGLSLGPNLGYHVVHVKLVPGGLAFARCLPPWQCPWEFRNVVSIHAITKIRCGRPRSVGWMSLEITPES